MKARDNCGMPEMLLFRNEMLYLLMYIGCLFLSTIFEKDFILPLLSKCSFLLKRELYFLLHQLPNPPHEMVQRAILMYYI